MAATAPEAAALRRALAGVDRQIHVEIVESGVGLARLGPAAFDGPVISCGVAGGLRDDLPTGTVVVADRVVLEDGQGIACDLRLRNALLDAARNLGIACRQGTLLTSRHLVRGEQRKRWADQGCLAADMETGLVKTPRLAAVRAILDTPQRELSAAWLHPASVLWHPAAWGEAVWLVRNAPRCARLAAAVVAAALACTDLWGPVDET